MTQALPVGDAIQASPATSERTSARPSSPAPPSSGFRWSKVVFPASVLIVVALIGTIASIVWPSPGTDTAGLLIHTVKRQDLPITIVERGNLESQDDVPILCGVDDFRRDGINGTPIVWVIPNGSLVKEGDLLVELDASPVREQLDEQILDTQQARELVLLAKARYDNQVSQNLTDEAEAKLKVRLAELELQMFEDEANGTHRLEVEEIRRTIEDLNNEILSAKTNLELKRNERDGIESLFKLGYAGKSEYDRSQLDFQQAESTFAAKVNRLQTQLATLKKKETYEFDMRSLELKGKLETARRGLDQVERNNEAQLTQLKASLDARKEQLAKEEELLKRYQGQFDSCKLFAPQDGMVAYADGKGVEIVAGAAVRMRQKILSIPKLSKMQVRTAVHESVLDQVKQGMRVDVRVDAFSDRVYEGVVHSVAVLPQNAGRGGDTRYYETIVLIEGEVSRLKPGMTAVVEVHVAHLEEVITAPVQAIIELDNQTFVFAEDDGNIERRPVAVGSANEYLVEVTEGLDSGEAIVLNPMSLGDELLQSDASEPSDNGAEQPAVAEPAP